MVPMMCQNMIRICQTIQLIFLMKGKCSCFLFWNDSLFEGNDGRQYFWLLLGETFFPSICLFEYLKRKGQLQLLDLSG